MAARSPRLHHFKHGQMFQFYGSLIRFMQEVYAATGGGYPRFEWVRKKVEPDSKEFPKWFEKNYGPFLKWRLRTEMDDMWLKLSKDNEILGVIAVNYDFSRTGKKHMRSTFRRLLNSIGAPADDAQRCGFIELFAVHPRLTRCGLGTALFTTALKELKVRKRAVYAATFHGLDPALRMYRRFGAESYEVHKFKWSLKDRRGYDYIIVRFPESRIHSRKPMPEDSFQAQERAIDAVFQADLEGDFLED